MKYKAKPLFSRSKEKDRAAEKKGKGGNVLSWAPVSYTHLQDDQVVFEPVSGGQTGENLYLMEKTEEGFLLHIAGK